MSRPHVSVPPEAIRIEDEVWQSAFARIEPPPRRRLRAIEGGRSMAMPVGVPPPADAALERASVPPRTAAALAPDTAAPPRVRQRRAESGATTTAAEALAPLTRPRSTAAPGVAGRRTVTIRGYGAERNLPWPEATRRRPQPRPYERTGFRPDRLAMWAVFLGVLLLLVAIVSGHS